MNSKTRIVVGMSGGVDSSVVAFMLKEQGYDVVGLFMRNWNDASVTLEDECPWIDDSRDAMMVAEQLGIPFQVIDLSDQYKERIVDYMFREYQLGRTPNPDVLCNREIKFDIFLNNALKLGADFVATGHYVRKAEINSPTGGKEYQLLSGLDPNKDQSYFLCQLNQFQLSKAMFPIGDLLKPEVRAIAERAGLVTAKKKDSQGLCFIGKVSLPEFLQQQLKVKTGKVVEIDRNSLKLVNHFNSIDTAVAPAQKLAKLDFDISDGKVVGEHQGAHFYTLGQRKGLQIGGKPLPLFVLQTNVEENLIFVGQGEDHLGLLSLGLRVAAANAHWVRPSMEATLLNSSVLQCRVRYRQALFDCHLLKEDNGDYLVMFGSAQKAVTPGQFVAIYFENELVFSGEID